MIMTLRLRKFALAAHITLAVGWIGAVAGYIALDVAAATSQDAQTLRAAYLAMELIAWYVIVPLALASLLTGLVMSLGTKWGLFRHYWVLISLLLTIIATVVLLVETQTISYFADIAADPKTSGDDLRALGNTLVHSVGGTVVLLVILVLNVYKPRGMTQYGWRKQQEQRRASQRSKQDEQRKVSQP
jgi:DMSO/TMAO reductase YedYZ heme-binding membrane subunit